jgi:hypothetical protein
MALFFGVLFVGECIQSGMCLRSFLRSRTVNHRDRNRNDVQQDDELYAVAVMKERSVDG